MAERAAITCGGAGERAHYETAVPGSFHLVPSPERRAQIERDYRGMADMFMATPPSFDSILQVLRGLEERINATASAV